MRLLHWLSISLSCFHGADLICKSRGIFIILITEDVQSWPVLIIMEIYKLNIKDIIKSLITRCV